MVSLSSEQCKVKSILVSLIAAYFEISEADDKSLLFTLYCSEAFKSNRPVCTAVLIACWVFSPLTIVLIIEGPIGLLS